MTLIWPVKVTKAQTDCPIRFATYEFLYVSYSNYSVISHRNPVFHQMTLIWLSRSPEVKMMTPSDLHHMSCYMRSKVTKALSRTETLFISRCPWSDLLRSPKFKLITPSDSHHTSCYMCSIVTIAPSHTETMFFSKWPWSDLPRSPNVKSIMPCDPRHINSY